LILDLVSLWLLVNSIKKEKSQRERPIDFFCFILLKDILLFYLFFGFQRGYATTERSDFILTDITIQMIGGNLFYFLIRRENDLNK